MPDHELYREASRWCFWVFQGDCGLPQRSPSEIMAGGAKGSMELKRTSAAISRRVHATNKARAQFSRPVIDGRYRGGRIFARINQLPEGHITTLRALYQLPGPDQYECQAKLANEIHEAYTAAWEGPLRAKTRNLIRVMVDTAIFAARNPAVARATLMTPHDLFGVGPKAWQQSYAKHWRGVRDMLHERQSEAAILAYQKSA